MRFNLLCVCSFLVIVATDATAQNISDLAAVRPGDVMPDAVKDFHANGPYWVSFGVPTMLDDLARYFPRGQVQALGPNGEVWRIFWKGTYLTQMECEQIETSVRELLLPYFPEVLASGELKRFQHQTVDMAAALGISCAEGSGGFWSLDMEVADLEQEAAVRAGLRGAPLPLAGTND